jgi:hypothetical protein
VTVRIETLIGVATVLAAFALLGAIVVGIVP